MENDHEDSTIVEVKKRWDATLHNYIKLMTESNIFNGAIIFTIFLNALFMAVETDVSPEEGKRQDLFKAFDNLFLAIYTVEFILKIYAEPRNYWNSSYNIFDFLILVISYVQLGMTVVTRGKPDSKLESLRVLRALRTLRTLRTVSFIRGLQVLVTALLDTIRKWVINILLLLLLLMFLFAIMGYYFFGYKEHYDKENWGSLSRAMLTLVSFVTVDGWTDKQKVLEDISRDGSRVYAIIFIFLGHFIFTNVFIGVIIMNISESTEAYKKEQRLEKEAVLRHKKELMMMRQHSDVKQMMERQKKGHYANFQEMVMEFQKGLRHDDSVMMSDLCTNLVWMETFIRSLDHMDASMYRLQQLHFEMANTLANAMDKKLQKKYGT